MDDSGLDRSGIAADDPHAKGARDLASAAAEWPMGRLLSMAARLVEQDWNSWLATRGMTHAGLLALHVLETGPHTQRELAAECMVEEQTMSRILDRLRRSGHITRERDAADRRRLVVRATQAGLLAYREAIQANVANTIVTRQLDEPDAFRRMLIQLITGLLATRGERSPDGDYHEQDSGGG